MGQEIHTFNMIRDNGTECVAELNGQMVKVDPYVGCVWSPDYFEKGKVTFDGHWWESMVDGEKVFLPRRQIFPEDLCAMCNREIEKESD